jgi:hypothetical protein
MKKSGATFHDKARICKLHNEGKNADQISALTGVRREHVVAIVEQHQSGTLKMIGRHAANYIKAEPGQQENIEPEVAAAEVAEHARQEQDSLARENAEQQDEIAALKAELAAAKKKAPRKKAARRKSSVRKKVEPEAPPEAATA